MNETKILNDYRIHRKKKISVLIILFAVSLLLVIVCINVGTSDMSLEDTVKALFGFGNNADVIIVRNIRLPRVLAALLCGVGLSVSGCIMQTVLKNPMASPTTLGVSNAAVFGANFAIIVFGAGAFNSTHGEALTVTHPHLVTVCALSGALICILVILALSYKRGYASETVVLAGVAIGFLFSAATTVVQYFAIDTQLASAVFWTFGDLGRASMKENAIIACTVAVSLLYFALKTNDYNAMSSGEETAKSLGVKTERVRFFSLLLASLICAVCVSFLGTIGFVGLIAPQAVKRFVGSDYRYLLPACALSGAALLLFADIVARSLPVTFPLPVGAVTSLFGAPLFLWILLKGRKGV